MTCWEAPLLPFLLVGGALGGGLYYVSAKRKRVAANIHLAVHSVTFGFLLVGALHLMYGALCPSQLVEVFDKDEKRLHPPDIVVKIELFHVLDILVGGGFLVYSTAIALKKIYQNPAEH